MPSRLGSCRLELAEDVVAEVDRLGQGLEPEPVLGQARDRKRPRDGPERDDELVVGDVDLLLVGDDANGACASSSRAVARPRSSSAWGHITRSGTTAWRGSSVPEAASGSIGV